MGFGPTAWTVAQLRAALAETCLAFADLAESLDAADWTVATGCPGWTVHDQIAHVTGVEASFVGATTPDGPFTAGPHVRNEFGVAMERIVDARRPRTPGELVAELRSTVAARQAALLAVGDDPKAKVMGVFGLASQATTLRLRVLDCVAHEQDVRRALGRPGHLDTDAGAITRDNSALGFAQSFATFAVERLIGLRIDDWVYLLDLTADRPKLATEADTGIGTPALTLTMSLADAIALGCGRTDADPSAVGITGDQEMGRALVAAMTFTP